MISIPNPFETEKKCTFIPTERLTQLIKTEERLQIVKDFVKSEQYVSKETLLILLGEKETR